MTSPRGTPPVSRGAAFAALGAGGLGLAMAATTRPAAAQVATPAATVERDVVYGEVDGQELLLDIYRPPARDAPRPAVILIHGGGWSVGIDRSVNAEPAQELAEAGYVAFNIDYRLMDGTPRRNVWPVQLDDVQRAVRWIRANATAYGVDPDRIGSYGGSSGGHLAGMLGVRETHAENDQALAGYSSRVRCVVDLAGDMDLTIPYPQALDRQIAIGFLGGTAAEMPDAYSDASPLAWVDGDTAPFLVVHGAADDINPVKHSRSMVAALHEAGVEVIYAEFPELGHLDVFDWRLHGPWTLAFFARHLQPER